MEQKNRYLVRKSVIKKIGEVSKLVNDCCEYGAESEYARELALEWIQSDSEWVAALKSLWLHHKLKNG